MGPLQYKLFASCSVAINRMFAMFHAQFPKLEQSHIVRGLVVGASKLQLLFVTVAFGIGLICQIENVLSILVCHIQLNQSDIQCFNLVNIFF